MKQPNAVLFIAAALVAGGACAKLPAQSDDAKAKAAETAARTAWTDKVGAFQTCKVQDKVVGQYRAEAQKQGKAAPPAQQTTPCTDPGPFVYTPPDARPLEASGAHSPAGNATQPPSQTAPHADAAGSAPKKP